MSREQVIEILRMYVDSPLASSECKTAHAIAVAILEEDEKKPEPKKTPIESLGLSRRAYNVLRRNGVLTLEEIHEAGLKRVKKFRGCGGSTLAEIAQKTGLK